jgi:hypothetical protein
VGCWAGARGLGGGCLLFLIPISVFFLKQTNNLNSNQDLNPHTQKPCTGMNATVNSYISLIN